MVKMHAPLLLYGRPKQTIPYLKILGLGLGPYYSKGIFRATYSYMGRGL
jgi:hypothetical protein